MIYSEHRGYLNLLFGLGRAPAIVVRFTPIGKDSVPINQIKTIAFTLSFNLQFKNIAIDQVLCSSNMIIKPLILMRMPSRLMFEERDCIEMKSAFDPPYFNLEDSRFYDMNTIPKNDLFRVVKNLDTTQTEEFKYSKVRENGIFEFYSPRYWQFKASLKRYSELHNGQVPDAVLVEAQSVFWKAKCVRQLTLGI